MKKFLAISLIVASTALTTTTPAHAAQISEEQAGVISMTCGSVQLQLKKLQKTDSRIRVFLGSKFEFAQTNLMTNLILRLVKNNLTISPFDSSRSTFSSEREYFKSAFTDYARSLDALISTNCQSNPYNFYDQLESTREKRENVRQSYLRLKDVLSDHRTIVVNFKDSL